MASAEEARKREGGDPVALEIGLQKLVAVYIVTGLLFLLLPGTFLGVWNLISITGRHSLAGLSQSWLQAHGHAQLFGWIGLFILGIGYYSLSKMGPIMPFSVGRGWASWALWTSGVTLRWTASVTEWNWRMILPLSAALELIAFLIFFATMSRHKSSPGEERGIEPWMKLVMASTVGLLLALLANLAVSVWLAKTASWPAAPHWLDQRYLFLAAWGFPVLAVWGFNARWLPVFLGLREPSRKGLAGALIGAACGILAALFGRFLLAAACLFAASLAASVALSVFGRSHKPPKTKGVTPAFPYFVRGAYVWLLIAGALGIFAAMSDSGGGIWGASRHALTVGFLANMVFAIGQRVLPAFCGMRLLYSKKLMFASLALLNVGCLLRVASEIPAYELNLQPAWKILPASAVIELLAVSLFALNLAVTLALPPPRVACRPGSE